MIEMNPVIKIGSQDTSPEVTDPGLAGVGLSRLPREGGTKHFSLHISSGLLSCGRGKEAGAVKCSLCGETWSSQNLRYQGKPG